MNPRRATSGLDSIADWVSLSMAWERNSFPTSGLCIDSIASKDDFWGACVVLGDSGGLKTLFYDIYWGGRISAVWAIRLR